MASSTSIPAVSYESGLLVPMMPDGPRLIQPTTYSPVRVAGTDGPSDEFRVDLVDEAVLQTLNHGGAVMSVDASDLPDGCDVAALLRY